ncbi:MAG TPA: hypothetical protein VK543_11810 [Puia sp.]|nr:hypothetical protein [Puia sp.]
MEVHHHPDVEKKSFKEYFLEFLMIFLAVTMGFFAENIREGISEHSRAKVFASSMLKDLQADSTQLQLYKSYFSYAANKLDTFMQLLQVAEPKDIPSGKLYWYGLFGGAHGSFVSNDATFQEMKSSGSLHFFEKNIEAEVAKYDRLRRYLQSTEQANEGLYTELRKCRALFFEFKYLDHANNIYQINKISFNQATIDSFLRSNPPLLNYDKILFNQYVELARSRFLRPYNIAYSDSLIRHASLLMSDLKKEYDLDNE